VVNILLYKYKYIYICVFVCVCVCVCVHLVGAFRELSMRMHGTENLKKRLSKSHRTLTEACCIH
jgi:succinate dehydrogenase/fumarate reductase cytochrome b subunit